MRNGGTASKQKPHQTQLWPRLPLGNAKRQPGQRRWDAERSTDAFFAIGDFPRFNLSSPRTRVSRSRTRIKRLSRSSSFVRRLGIDGTTVPRVVVERKILDSIHGGFLGPQNSHEAIHAQERARNLLEDHELQRILSQPAPGEIPSSRQIFVDRNLAMNQVDLIGFDMDYTLAIYHLRRLESLSYDMTVDLLIRSYGYPEAIRQIAYDHQFVLRGLFVDKKHGNLLKIDRFGHVGRAFHGRTPLTETELNRLYRNERIRLKNPEYAWIDTLFALPEACLLAGIIDLFENRLNRSLDFTKLYDDIREAIDTVHRNNSLKTVIRENMSRYIFKDPELGPALHRLRSGGKKLFLLTNSLWDYTRAVMEYLLDGVSPEYPSWKNYFDFIITGGGKPGFFTSHGPFVEIDTSSDNNAVLGEAKTLERGKVYQGGNLSAFEQFTGYAGDRVLYVGDHIYGDILKSKKTSMWRTCMIVQEIEDEIAYLESRRDEIERLSSIEQLRAQIDDEIAKRRTLLNQIERKLEKNHPTAGEATALEDDFRRVKHDLDRLRKSARECADIISTLERDIDRGFNLYWGLHFKEGNENSRFGEQVEQYACLYTSRVSNFVYYSPLHHFRTPRDFMPHESGGTPKLGLLGSDGLPKATLRAADIP